MILLDFTSWMKSHGHYEVNRNSFPDGLSGLKQIIDRFRAEGIKVGLHLLAPAISNPDPYLTPVPDKRLIKDMRLVLANSLDPDATFIETTEPPIRYPKEEKDPYHEPGRTLWIDDELIYYNDLSLEKPYGFKNCVRGLFGTGKANHAKGSELWHLNRTCGYYKYDLTSTLAEEVGKNFARIANTIQPDMIYFDGSEQLQTPDVYKDLWYYNSILHRNFFERLIQKDILCQASTVCSYSWHMMARTASADGHDDLKAYLEERAESFQYYGKDLFPLDIGWYYLRDKNATPDMYEYILSKTIAYDASFSIQFSAQAARDYPFRDEVLDLIRQYDQLRLSGKVPKDLREKMKIDPVLFGKKSSKDRDMLLDKRLDFRLMKKSGQNGFQRVIYGSWHEFLPNENRNEYEFEITVKEGISKIGFQIQVKNPNVQNAKGTNPAIGSPQIQIGDRILKFPESLSAGQYGFYWSGEPLTVYGSPLTQARSLSQKGETLELAQGTWKVRFSCSGKLSLPVRIRLTQLPDEFYPVQE